MGTVSNNEYVSHNHFNIFYQYVQTFYSFLQWLGNTYFNGFFNLVSAIGSQWVNYVSEFVFGTSMKKSMDILLSRDWNLLTKALYGIDYILNTLLKMWYTISISDSASGTELLQGAFLSVCGAVIERIMQSQVVIPSPSKVFGSISSSAGASKK
jgi:hypothetical protein